MARLFRLWGKKRGRRRSGSELLGGLGEALFFGLLFLFGAVSLAVMATSWVLDPLPNLRYLPLGVWLLLAVSVSFVLIGGAGVWRAVSGVAASAERRAALARKASSELRGRRPPPGRKPEPEFPGVPDPFPFTNSPGVTLAYRLPLAQSPAWRLLASAVFCLVWTAVTSVILALVVNQALAGRVEWLQAAALVGFLAVAAWSIYYFASQLLVHTGIGPTCVEISDHPLRPGGRYEVAVSQPGRLSVERLELVLQCEEQATYREGTNVRTESCVVYERRLLRREAFRIAPNDPFACRAPMRIPSGAMHSFQSRHNAVVWKLVVRGAAEGWPPFTRSFPVLVRPEGERPEGGA